jgi:Sugar phosphate isomerases/epimerases
MFMPGVNRRQFLGLLAASAAPLRARTLPVIGVQLYTLRNVLPEKPLETLRALEEIGFQEVEAVGGDLDKIWPSLKQTSLKPTSLHLNTALFTREQDKLPAALDDAAKRGFRYVVCPYIAPRDRGGADVMRRLGETLNKAGEVCKKAGLRLCYHNHAFEFEPAGDGTLLDVLMKATDPALVGLELDMMWSQVAGVSPVSVLEKYGKRVELMHLKDLAPDVEKRYNEGIPRMAFREVGNGVIDVPAVLRAASKAGVKHYFVEQDQTPGDPLASLKQSHSYLKKLNF